MMLLFHAVVNVMDYNTPCVFCVLFRELKVSETQTQIVFPNTLDDKDLAVAKHLAEGMDLGWEELPKGLKVFQKLADADHDGQ